jgi:hypothetical protein
LISLRHPLIPLTRPDPASRPRPVWKISPRRESLMKTMTHWDPMKEMAALESRCAKLFALVVAEAAELAQVMDAGPPPLTEFGWALTAGVADAPGKSPVRTGRSQVKKRSAKAKAKAKAGASHAPPKSSPDRARNPARA